MGLDVEVPPEDQTPGGKPEEISDREVEAWLQVFHDDPDSEIPPPNLPKPKPRPRVQKPKEAVVRKDGNLSSEEVDSWLAVFSEQETSAASDSDAVNSTDSPIASQSGGASAHAKLAEHREKFAPAEGQEKADLPEEDLELWHRLFGEES
jgi:hypothetical protein